jgi:hypothetical protein
MQSLKLDITKNVNDDHKMGGSIRLEFCIQDSANPHWLRMQFAQALPDQAGWMLDRGLTHQVAHVMNEFDMAVPDEGWRDF